MADSLQRALEELDDVQESLAVIDDEAGRRMLEIERESSLQRTPVYEHRAAIIAKIPGQSLLLTLRALLTHSPEEPPYSRHY